ncbi:MAG: FHA domain-containing protein, partial [Treponema sp.]|nr:FHA domain-containing protein [Treponema sp.]
TNGTFLNDHRIPPDKYITLSTGDKITVGTATLVMG